MSGKHRGTETTEGDVHSMRLLDLLAAKLGQEQGVKPTAPLDSCCSADTKNQGCWLPWQERTQPYAGRRACDSCVGRVVCATTITLD